MEYVLVREPRQMNKSKAFKKRKRNYKFNRRMTDYSDSSKDKAIIRNFGDSSSNNENSEKIPYRKLTYDSGLIFKKNERSRFDFVKGNNSTIKEHCVAILEYVYDIIDEKINKFFTSDNNLISKTNNINKNVEIAWKDLILGKA